MIETGHMAAFLALGFSLAQAGLGLAGARQAAGRLALAAMFAMTLSFALLVTAFAGSDFSVELVANNSHTLKPFIYKIAGTWGNHEGSMALWCLIAIGYGGAAAWLMRTGRYGFEARAIGVQGLVASGSLAYLLYASNPFTRLELAPLQGAGLNPVLQDPALAIHPPMLYFGYVGYSFVFSLAAAGLIEGRIDRIWAKASRAWVLAAFVPLTIGILLGAYWAYYELGWGGWWFWDPVENASLMPWLIGAALLHSMLVTEKRGSFGAWTALLAVLAFCFSLLGTFLVRSGVLTSVHAFAIDPLRGSILLGGLVVYGGAALLLFAIRAPALKGGPDWDIASREGALMANNLVLTVATVTVLLGTLFPLIAEAAGQQMTVGEPYFHLTFAPIMAVLLVLLPAVQSWSWGRADLSSALKWMFGFGALLLAVWLLGINLWNLPLGAVIGVALGLWLVIGSVLELQRRAITLKRLFRLPLRVWGMSLAHIGLGLFVIGAVVETGGRYEGTLALEPGQSGEVAGWSVTLDTVSGIEGPNWYADKAHLTVQRGDTLAVLEPQKRYYPAAGMPSTETAILKTGFGDLYAAIGDKRDVGGRSRWTFRIYYNPLIDLVFLGALLVGLGGLLAMFGGRKQKPVDTTDPAQEASI